MLGSAEGQSEEAGLVEPPEETEDTILELNPVHEGPKPRCSAAAMDGHVDGDAVHEPQGAAAWETGWVTGGLASGRDFEDGGLGAPQTQDLVPALGVLAGCMVDSPGAELGGGSFRLGGLRLGRGGSAGGDDDGGRWGDGGGGGCCCC